MSTIRLINGSCADQTVDAVVNAANSGLWAGGGICGVIFRKAGMTELTNACRMYETPLRDGDAVITPSFQLKNAKAIIHAVGPNFAATPKAFRELYDAYYHSLVVLKENGYHTVAFPLISSGIFGGSLENPSAESARQCLRAYRRFTADHPDYDVDVTLCAFSKNEMIEAEKQFQAGGADAGSIGKNETNGYQYITLREQPERMDGAAEWFHGKWRVPVEAYRECMEAYLKNETEYGWYLCLYGGEIVGGLGVIENDFHDRKDLKPNVCAVYTEKRHRGRGIAGHLLDMAVDDLRSRGITPVYLVTDHTGFYERYGWEFLCMVQGDGEPEMTRMYIHR